MTAALAYAAAVLLVLSVLLSRAARRQLATARKGLAADEALAVEAARDLQEALRALSDAEERKGGLDARVEQAQAEVGEAQRALDTARRTPVERYHVFDRLEPRPGTIWAVQVAHAPWGGERTYLMMASNQADALERAGLRFPRAGGFEVRKAMACGLFDAAKRR